ncbi:MAG: amino acid ABC transporter ATP-binding protein [Candidatus Babeliales bacterium]
MLTITNLSKAFGKKKILNNVSLTVTQGEIAILLGSSGVGKSTLLRILNNLETYDAGTITFDGKPLNQDTITNTHIIGMVFQQFHLFDHLSALQNITLALEKVQGVAKQEAEEQAKALLAQYDLADKAHMYPQDLSGGQKQRLALARMLALKPRILCLDEPTSALDPVLTAHVAQTIMELAQHGVTVLITTHDTSLVNHLKTATIHLMENGAIIESAPQHALFNNPQQYPQIAQFIAGKQRSIPQA